MNAPTTLPSIGTAVPAVAIVTSWGMVITGWAGYAAPIIASIASMVAILYYCMQIYDSKIVSRLFSDLRQHRANKLQIVIARLVAKAKATETEVAILRNAPPPESLM